MFKSPMKLVALSLASALVLSITACGSNAQSSSAQISGSSSAAAEKVTLKVMVHYTSADEKATWDYAMTKMKKIMPNVSLEIDPTPQDSDAKLKTEFASGSLPDIFDLNLSNIPLGVKSNNLLSLDDYVTKYKIADKLTSTGVSLLNQHGHTWSILSANTNFAVIYANKALFDQAGAKIPENYDQLLKAGKQLKAKGILPLGIWLKEAWPAIQLFDMASIPENPKGVTALDQNGTETTKAKAYVDAAQKIHDMVNTGILSKDASTTDYNSAVAQFESGKSAMFLCGNWMAQEFGEKLGNNATILLPNIFADASVAQDIKNSGALSGGGFAGGYAVAANGKYKEIAAEYAVQAAMYAIEGRIVKTGEQNTMLKSAPASEKPANALTNQLTGIISNVKTSTTMGWSFESAKINTDLYSKLSSLYTGQYKPEDFANDTAKLIAADRAVG
jgi:raffinose/stachyose/melibiose transport system substrate-binding protein